MGTYCDLCGKKTGKIVYFSSYTKQDKLKLLDYDWELCNSCAKKLDIHMKKFIENPGVIV